MMRFIKKNKFYFLSFLVPFLFIGIIFFLKGAFTSKIISNSDLLCQHLPIISYLRNLLHGQENFPYSFSKGLGGSMYGAFLFCTSSPLNLLVYFFDDLNLFATLLIMVKISLCGLSMFIYLKSKKTYKDFHIFVFSLAYALMGYNINYYENIMWLDTVFLAPLVIMGV